jgi:hypothetical protein
MSNLSSPWVRGGGHNPSHVRIADQLADDMLTALRNSATPLTIDEMAHQVGITGDLAEDLASYLRSYGRITRNSSRYGLVAWQVAA